MQCKTIMGSYTKGNDTYACDNSNCMISCASPEFGARCYGIQQNFLDGTSCTGGGQCSNVSPPQLPLSSFQVTNTPHREYAKAAPSAKKSPPGSNATSPSSSASQPESAAPSSSASSAAVCAPTAVAPNSRNTLRLPRPCPTNPAVAQGGTEAALWALLPWANITTVILLRRDRHHQMVQRRRGNQIHMRQMAMCPCRRRCIGVVCGMRKLFGFLFLFSF